MEMHEPVADKRLWELGTGLFVLSIVVPFVGVPIVVALDLSKPMTATFSGALLALGELLGIAAVAPHI